MAGDKYLAIDNATGLAKEVAALQTSAGGSDAGHIVALNSSGQVDSSMLPASSGMTNGQAMALIHNNFLFS
jgi:hypothetical protein